jgi:hypothetical protein
MLESLADELLLEVFRHLRLARKLTNDDYFQPTGIAEARACFTSLCLTSKRLCNIARPFIYGDLVTSESGRFEAHVAVRISRALRTIMRNPALASNIDYIEHNFTECGDEFDKQHSAYKAYYTSAEWKDHRVQLKSTASSTWAGDDLKTWEKQLNRYPEVAQLALLLALAPNVTHIHRHYARISSSFHRPIVKRHEKRCQSECHTL